MRRRRVQSIISTLLLVTSLALLGIVGYLYFTDRDNGNEPTPPTPIPGHNQAIDVLNALRAQDLDAEFGAQGSDVRSTMLERPGQTIELREGTAYVFIYPDLAAQEAATLDVLAEDVDLVDVSGDPIDIADAHLFTGSNVAVFLVTPDQETVERVEIAVSELQ